MISSKTVQISCCIVIVGIAAWQVISFRKEETVAADRELTATEIAEIPKSGCIGKKVKEYFESNASRPLVQITFRRIGEQCAAEEAELQQAASDRAQVQKQKEALAQPEGK